MFLFQLPSSNTGCVELIDFVFIRGADERIGAARGSFEGMDDSQLVVCATAELPNHLPSTETCQAIQTVNPIEVYNLPIPSF